MAQLEVGEVCYGVLVAVQSSACTLAGTTPVAQSSDLRSSDPFRKPSLGRKLRCNARLHSAGCPITFK